MDDVVCLVPEKTSLQKGKAPEEELGLCPHSERRAGKDEQTCGGRSFQTHGEISSARGGGTRAGLPGLGGTESPGGAPGHRGVTAGSRALLSAEEVFTA